MNEWLDQDLQRIKDEKITSRGNAFTELVVCQDGAFENFPRYAWLNLTTTIIQ